MALNRRWLVSLHVAFLIAACLGCGVEPPEGLVPAEGVFNWETGERLSGHQGVARFHPYDPTKPKIEGSAKSGDEVVSARLETDGTFLVRTSRMVDGKAHEFSGAVPGLYKVLLFLLPGEGGLEQINPDYNHPVRSPLLVEIKKDDPNHLELKLERHLNGWSP